MNVVDARRGPWPEAVSDGLTLPCAFCAKVPDVDWRTTEDEWQRVIPKRFQLGVVCLGCFIWKGGDARLVEQIQVVVPGATFVCEPLLAVLWEKKQ